MNLQEKFWQWLANSNTQLKSISLIIGILGTTIGGGYWVYTLMDPSPVSAQITMSLDEYEKRQLILREKIIAELKVAAFEDRARLNKQLAEVNARLADSETALIKANLFVESLEKQLNRDSDLYGADKLDQARMALAEGDYSVADNLFAEIEAQSAIALQSAARAAFARGEIAEANIRWADAAEHYARAVGFDPTLKNLFKAREFAHKSGDLDTALGFGETVLKLIGNSNDRISLGKALNDHAVLFLDIGHYDDAERLLREVISITEMSGGKNSPDYAAVLNNLAQVLNTTGRYDEAETLYRQAMRITAATLGEDHPHYAIRLNNLANLLKATGRYDEAEPLFREAMQIKAATLGKIHPTYAISLNNLAQLFQATGRYDEAETLYRQAMQITAASLGDDHPDYAIQLNGLASLYQATGRYDEAENLYRKAMRINGAKLGLDHPEYGANLNNLAMKLHATGRLDEAESLFREALQIVGASLGTDHPNYAATLNNLAFLYYSTERFDEALLLMEQALVIRESALGNDHPDTVGSRQSLAEMRKAAGQ